jgi:hypothetical protein
VIPLSTIFTGFSQVLLEVAIALLPLLAIFLFMQVFFLKLPAEKVRSILLGFLLTYWGLAFFFQGVGVGFYPTGQHIGVVLGSMSKRWVLIPIGFVLGLAIAFAEPAVRVLTYEAEKASGGSIPQSMVLYTVSLGVAASVALAMARILFGISLWYFIIPGYLLVFIMVHYSKASFVALAFDSGGAATGPMTVTFIMAMALGVATTMHNRNPLLDGFGLVSLVALAPILSVLTLGILYTRKEKSIRKELEEREREIDIKEETDS